jgi:segregation and condensation protein B
VEEIAGGFRLMTRPQFGAWVKRLAHVPPEVRLSAPALETLAVVAYRQPVLKATVEAIRGVHCGEVVRQLMERDLVRIVGRSEDLGRPYLYAPTPRFLEVFGLRSLDELPRVEGLRPPGAAAATEYQQHREEHDVTVTYPQQEIETVRIENLPQERFAVLPGGAADAIPVAAADDDDFEEDEELEDEDDEELDDDEDLDEEFDEEELEEEEWEYDDEEGEFEDDLEEDEWEEVEEEDDEDLDDDEDWEDDEDEDEDWEDD